MKRIFFPIVLVLLGIAASGQMKPRNQVGLSVGWQNFSFLDQHSSPLTYGTNSLFPKVGIFYNRQADRSIFDVQVSASNGAINPARFGERSYLAKWSDKDSFQYHPGSNFIHANITADYFKKVSSLSGEKIDYWVGGSFNEAAYYTDAVANSDWLLNVADIAPAMQVQYRPAGKHSLKLRIDLSVLGLITRPVYSLFAKSSKDKNIPSYFKQGTHLASVNKFQKFNFQVGYQYRVARHFTAGLEYKQRWFHYSLPQDIRAIDKEFDVKLSYTY